MTESRLYLIKGRKSTSVGCMAQTSMPPATTLRDMISLGKWEVRRMRFSRICSQVDVLSYTRKSRCPILLLEMEASENVRDNCCASSVEGRGSRQQATRCAMKYDI